MKKFVLLSLCVAVCTLTFGCGGGGGSPEQDAIGKKAVLDAAAKIQKEKAEREKKK
jgi:hypothetical protein